MPPFLAPDSARETVKRIRREPLYGLMFAHKVLARLEELIPRDQRVRIEDLEEAFLIATETRAIFSRAGVDIWKFFPRPQHRSLLGEVFISAVDGLALADIIEKVGARAGSKNERGELWFDAAKLNTADVYRFPFEALSA
jgi:hypothetical protein